MNLFDIIEQLPLREGGATPFSKSLVQPFDGFENAFKRGIERTPGLRISIPICIENQSNSVTLSLVSRETNEICRRNLNINEAIEEVGPFYLQIKR